MSLKESQFQKKVKSELDTREKLYYFVKEAGSIRGISDIVGCYNGHYFAMELKRSESEARKNTGRIVLQRYTLRQVSIAGGFGYIVHPQNLQEVLQDLDSRCLPRSRS